MTVSTAPQPVVRAGDRDREKTAALLGRGLTQGYLEMHEYEQRVGAFAARTAANFAPWWRGPSFQFRDEIIRRPPRRARGILPVCAMVFAASTLACILCA